MRKNILLLALSICVLAACSGTGPAATPTIMIVKAPSYVTPRPVYTAAPKGLQIITLTPAQAATTNVPGCTVISSLAPAATTDLDALLGPVTAQDYVRGPATATITLLEYSDFQCEYCAGLTPILNQLLKDYPNDVRLVFRYYPLIGTPEQPVHDKAAISAQAAEAAAKQGKFWEMSDVLMGRESDWAGLSVAQFQEWVASRAGELGLKVDQFTSDMNSPAIVAKIQAAWENGQKIGIPYVPYLLIDGAPFGNVPPDYANFQAIINLTLLEKRQFTSCPPMTINPAKRYVATIKTAKGDIVLDLYPDKAPLAVNSFVFLARNGWYDHVTFTTVIRGNMAQAGDPSGTGFGGPGYAFENEIRPDLTFDQPGVLAMVNAGGDTNGSQFFITYSAQPSLNGRFTIFGQVIAGMDVLNNLTPRDPSVDNRLPPGDMIETITIEEK